MSEIEPSEIEIHLYYRFILRLSQFYNSIIGEDNSWSQNEPINRLKTELEKRN